MGGEKKEERKKLSWWNMKYEVLEYSEKRLLSNRGDNKSWSLIFIKDPRCWIEPFEIYMNNI